MANIHLPDEQYQTLRTLAQDKGMSPEQLLAVVIEQMEIARERAEYGDAFIEELRQQAGSPVETQHFLTEDAFFAELDANTTTLR